METASEFALRQGLITSEQREAVSGLNGHSSAITKKYYVYLDRGSEISRAQALFELSSLPSASSPSLLLPPAGGLAAGPDVTASVDPLPVPLPLPLPTGAANVAEVPLQWTMREELKHKEWGTAHPCQAVNPKKVVWSDDELNYLRRWLEDQMRLFPDREQNTACWRALEDIMSCPEARAVFHRNHILSTGRLRSGFDHLMPREKKKM